MVKLKEKFITTDFDKYNIPTSVDEFIAWVNKKVDEQPVSRDEINIEIDYNHRYGETYPCLTLSYVRPETKEEQAERVKMEKHRDEAERRKYLELKKKFGD